MEENQLFSNLTEYIESIEKEFDTIPPERKKLLKDIAGYADDNITINQPTKLVFICTHNSRRSHMSQLWAQAAASYYGIPNISCYSGGTKATAFNPRAVAALQRAGFSITTESDMENRIYLVGFSEGTKPVKAFSKRFEDPYNPQEGFMAVMTCSDADEACPFVPGAEKRVAIPYEDPKISDDTPEEAATYDARCRQIAREMLFIFSQID